MVGWIQLGLAMTGSRALCTQCWRPLSGHVLASGCNHVCPGHSVGHSRLPGFTRTASWRPCPVAVAGRYSGRKVRFAACPEPQRPRNGPGLYNLCSEDEPEAACATDVMGAIVQLKADFEGRGGPMDPSMKSFDSLNLTEYGCPAARSADGGSLCRRLDPPGGRESCPPGDQLPRITPPEWRCCASWPRPWPPRDAWQIGSGGRFPAGEQADEARGALCRARERREAQEKRCKAVRKVARNLEVGLWQGETG